MLERKLGHHLAALYDADTVASTLPRLLALAERHRRPRTAKALDEQDVWLIAYGDHVSEGGATEGDVPDGDQPPLRSLKDVLDGRLAGVVNGVHLLPCYPATSDGGFAVVDHRRIDPALGDWDDVAALASAGRRLMLDAVVNHVSAGSPHVRDWSGHVLEPPAAFDTSQVVRPRTSPLLTPFERPDGGIRYAWTTFSSDQVDLDYANPEVLVDMTAVLLEYVGHGATVIRLDAVGFLWKSSGMSCLNLPQTHEVVRLWRTIMDWCAPGTLLVTETNVPHEENLAYLGDGTDEAHLVYQFPLAPLVLSTFAWGNAQDLTRWAASLETPPGSSTWFNFLGSHDGIGLRPVEGRLSSTQIEGLKSLAMAAGGGVSFRSDAAGGQTAYELNSTMVDALMAVADDGLGVHRVLAAHAILLALQGVAGLWLGSLFGVPGWDEGVQSSGELRMINRRKLTVAELDAMMDDPRSPSATIFRGIADLVALRSASQAFSPYAFQQILPAPPWLVAIQRGTDDHRHLVLVSVSSRDRQVQPAAIAPGLWHDLLGGSGSRPYGVKDTLVLPPYGVAWLRDLG